MAEPGVVGAPCFWVVQLAYSHKGTLSWAFRFQFKDIYAAAERGHQYVCKDARVGTNMYI